MDQSYNANFHATNLSISKSNRFATYPYIIWEGNYSAKELTLLHHNNSVFMLFVACFPATDLASLIHKL